MYKKKLDEILIGKKRLNKKEFSEEDKVGIIEHGLPKKMWGPKNYVLPVKISSVVEMVALVDTGASVMGEVKNMRIQIGYQAYVVDLLILDIPVDPELPLLLGRPFLRTYGAIIDMGICTLYIDDGVIRHTYFPKPWSKSYVEAFEIEGEDDWLGSFEVGRDEDGNVKYGPVAPSFIDIEDDMERALAMEAYFNPFKNAIVFKKLVDFLGSLPVQLKNLDWGNEGYGTYKKVDGDGDWHASRKDTLPNLLIAEYEIKNKRNTITYSLQLVSNANLKWKDLSSVERHVYCEKLSKLQERSFGVPRVANWCLFDGYGFEDTLREMMKLEYIYEGDGNIFDVDRNNLMKEKCIWFRLCGHEHILTLPEFAVVLGLFTEDKVKHHLFEVYFGWLEVDDKQFDHKNYWTRVGKTTLTNHKEVLMKEPLMRIVHKVIVGSLVHRVSSRERSQKQDLWMMSALEESRGVNLAWIIADHLYKHASGTKENSVICVGYYVTKIACFLGYCMDDEIKKCSEPIDSEEGSSEPRQEHGGLNSSWGDWNASLSEIERGNVWRDSMLIRNNYMLEHSMPILHHLADQGSFAYPTYEPPNFPPYPYPYIPYPNPGNQSNQGGSYGLGGDDYFTSAMPDFRGSSRGTGFNDDDDMD
ncbi:retrovirus-related pol polyprotein from transposon TNT 1-94 [Tanacetum coccineum]